MTRGVARLAPSPCPPLVDRVRQGRAGGGRGGGSGQVPRPSTEGGARHEDYTDGGQCHQDQDERRVWPAASSRAPPPTWLPRHACPHSRPHPQWPLITNNCFAGKNIIIIIICQSLTTSSRPEAAPSLTLPAALNYPPLHRQRSSDSLAPRLLIGNCASRLWNTALEGRAPKHWLSSWN